MICLNIFSINLLSNKYSTGSIPRTQTLELLLRITLQQINLAFLLHRTLLYRCQYCNAELIGCLEENQFPSIRNRIYPMSYIYIYIGFVVDTFFYICILNFLKDVSFKSYHLRDEFSSNLAQFRFSFFFYKYVLRIILLTVRCVLINRNHWVDLCTKIF